MERSIAAGVNGSVRVVRDGARDGALSEAATGAQSAGEPGYAGSRFAEVWRAVTAEPYDVLPDRRLRPLSALRLLRQGIYRDARRTLARRDDLLPRFDKLVHPSGVCLSGSWRITARTPYSGLFRTGAEGLIIARASDAVGEHRPNKLRLMGLAGKLYPTTDPQHAEPLPTANFFTLENIGGSHTPHFVDATFSTDLLPLRPRAGLLSKLAIGAVVGPAFMIADRALQPSRPLIRQLYPIAALGEPAGAEVRAPVVMRLVGSPFNRRVDTPDLREELAIEHHPEGLRFDIQVADHRSYFRATGFRTIGTVHFGAAVASWGGDHRLHFHHPRYRRDAR